MEVRNEFVILGMLGFGNYFKTVPGANSHGMPIRNQNPHDNYIVHIFSTSVNNQSLIIGDY